MMSLAFRCTGVLVAERPGPSRWWEFNFQQDRWHSLGTLTSSNVASHYYDNEDELVDALKRILEGTDSHLLVLWQLQQNGARIAVVSSDEDAFEKAREPKWASRLRPPPDAWARLVDQD